MSNKPALPNAYVDQITNNLGNVANSPSGVMAFTGPATGGTATAEAIVAVATPNDVKTLIGYGELADDLLDHFANGGKKVYAVPSAIDTISTLSDVTPTRVDASDGTIAIDADSGGAVTNVFDCLVEITKTGVTGTGKMKVSTDGGENYSPEFVIPATYTIPGTNIEMTMTDGSAGFDDGDVFAFTASAPTLDDATIEAAVQLLVDSDYSFDAVVVAHPVDATLLEALKDIAVAAEATPNFRNCYIIAKPALSASAAAAITGAQTLLAAVKDRHVQLVAGEMVMSRPNHSDQADRNVIGVISGRRSSLAISEDIGLYSAGALSNILSARTGWTETTIIELDALYTVTVRRFKGSAGWRVTNGWMTDPFSDFKKDSWVLVANKASKLSRLAALQFLKMKVNPANVSGSTEALRQSIQGVVDTMSANGDCVSAIVNIPEGQDILTTEEIIVEENIIPFGHASYIGIRVGLINPLKAA